ncbi:hypothetical protein EUA59_01540 [TM7 phylum sp. oral taxon 346]|nr:hypothetical protein EUA59_01540 [TM7 phylum sp. oral taxon 346]
MAGQSCYLVRVVQYAATAPQPPAPLPLVDSWLKPRYHLVAWLAEESFWCVERQHLQSFAVLIAQHQLDVLPIRAHPPRT